MTSGRRIVGWAGLTLLLLVLMQSSALADTRVLSITFLPMTTCDEVWNWNGCASKMTDTVFGDPGGAGHCYWIQPSGRIKMYPARLEVDLSSLAGLDRVEIDVNELEYAGRTKAYAYAAGEGSAFSQAASSGAGAQTLQVDVSAERPVRLAVACADCEVTQVRLVSAGTIVPVDGESFTTLKALFGLH